MLCAYGLEGAVQVVGIEKVAWVKADKHDSEETGSDPASKAASLTESEIVTAQKLVLDLYDTHNVSLYRYLRSLGMSRDKSEDLIQELFLRLVAHLRSRGNKDNLRAWLFQVAYNLSMDVHRANSRGSSESDEDVLNELVDEHGSPEWIYLQQEEMRFLKAALLRLTPKQHNAILLRAEGLPYREIGAVLGVTEQRAIHLVKRAVARLTEGR